MDFDLTREQKMIRGEVRNFTKKEIAPRGEILGDLFEIHDLIWETDQGKSFRAFWEFLMSSEKQDELNELIQQVLSLPEIENRLENSLIEDFKINLVEAGDKVNKTTHQPQINNILERPFFTPQSKVSISEIEIIEGLSDDSADILYSQHYINKEELKEKVVIDTRGVWR